VRLTEGEGRHPIGVRIQSRHPESTASELEGQGEADIPLADDGDGSCVVLDSLREQGASLGSEAIGTQ